MRSVLRTPFVKSEPFRPGFYSGTEWIPLASERVMAPRGTSIDLNISHLTAVYVTSQLKFSKIWKHDHILIRFVRMCLSCPKWRSNPGTGVEFRTINQVRLARKYYVDNHYDQDDQAITISNTKPLPGCFKTRTNTRANCRKSLTCKRRLAQLE
ncbi:hypothetical protein TcasGA2_TC003339 [Tribolium castaneum]|uniref:Uncharacterized protein n=1 Tax=Tribolium castaneum TaxID=7070 RepID=D6WFB6_TRICA|nr:hypothetical protein TcasGA2_TC003339 [Tribolium castaneum]